MQGKDSSGLSPRKAQQIRALVVRVAKKHHVPPAYIVAHVHSPGVHEARLEVWRVMITEMGILRTHVARMFWRSERRLRKSELGF